MLAKTASRNIQAQQQIYNTMTEKEKRIKSL